MNKFNLINPNNNENKIQLNEKSAFKPNNIIINNSQDKYSHRVMDELITNKIDDKTMEIITQVAKKIDEEYLDFLLNNSTKPILIFQYFSCYIATFTPKMLQNIDPNNAKILENINIKFIILARESYNIAMELIVFWIWQIYVVCMFNMRKAFIKYYVIIPYFFWRKMPS